MNATIAPSYVEPVVKTTRVKATPAHAFEVFTRNIKAWWKPEHSINPTRSAIDKIVLEPRAGGRWYEIGVDGSECEWGRVLAWDPPKRVVLAWQITTQWTYDANLHTELEVRFEPQGAETVVTLEHRLLENWGEKARETRDAVNGGWGSLVDRLAAAIEGRPLP
ncbi:MAG TPA: SRPBCC family protein [Usitatibacter sp.]|nr:SRPBCC family protein [Usitatibacter sp.]